MGAKACEDFLVLHHAPILEAACAHENIAADEEGLVAKKSVRERRPKVHVAGQERGHSTRMIEAQAKRAANHVCLLKRARDGRRRSNGKHRIGVQKEEHVPGGDCGRTIERGPASPGQREHGGVGSRELRRTVRAAPVGHDQLVRRQRYDGTAKRLRDNRFFIEGRNDDRQLHEGVG